MPLTGMPNHEAAILTRLVGPGEPTLPPAAAEALLSLGFSPGDKERMRELAARARTGALTADEQAEIEAYSRINSLLGVLKSQARRALKRHGRNGTQAS